ncbi:MAG: hypothetical protein AB7F29_13935 [Candidatus Nitrosocosmicus sp.]
MTNLSAKYIEKFYESALRKQETPFTQIYNFVIQNLLHHEALIVWIYLQSKHPTWKVNREEILNHFVNIGRDKLKYCIDVLKEVGLIEIYSIREKGRIVGWETFVKCGIGCEDRILAHKEKMLKDKGISMSQNTENDDHQNTENQASGEIKKIVHKPSAGAGSHQKPEKPESGVDPHIIIKRSKKKLKDNKDQNIDVSKTQSSGDNQFPDSPSEQVSDSEAIATKKRGKKEMYQETLYMQDKKTDESSDLTIDKMLASNPYNIDPQTLMDWIAVRKKKKAALTPTAWKQLHRELDKLVAGGLDPIEHFEHCIAMGWAGCVASWFINKDKMNSPKPSLTPLDHDSLEWAKDLLTK